MIKPSIGQNIEQDEPLYTVGQAATWYTCLGDNSVLNNQFEEVYIMSQ